MNHKFIRKKIIVNHFGGKGTQRIMFVPVAVNKASSFSDWFIWSDQEVTLCKFISFIEFTPWAAFPSNLFRETHNRKAEKLAKLIVPAFESLPLKADEWSKDP
jgi:hypothetical protein